MVSVYIYIYYVMVSVYIYIYYVMVSVYIYIYYVMVSVYIYQCERLVFKFMTTHLYGMGTCCLFTHL